MLREWGGYKWEIYSDGSDVEGVLDQVKFNNGIEGG